MSCFDRFTGGSLILPELGYGYHIIPAPLHKLVCQNQALHYGNEDDKEINHRDCDILHGGDTMRYMVGFH
jgi:hypothetical protein